MVSKFLEGRVVGVDLNLVLGWLENHIAQPGFSSVVQILIVAKYLMNLIAVITLGGQDCLTTCMPAQNLKIFLCLLTNFAQIASPAFPLILYPNFSNLFPFALM